MDLRFEQYRAKVGAGEISISQACAALGISRQTWYNRIKSGGVRKRGRPAKHPKAETAAPAQDWALAREIEKQEQEVWLRDLGMANISMVRQLDRIFPNLWCNLRFEHVDAAGYWYTFALRNDDRRQTWCVRHAEFPKT